MGTLENRLFYYHCCGTIAIKSELWINLQENFFTKSESTPRSKLIIKSDKNEFQYPRHGGSAYFTGIF